MRRQPLLLCAVVFFRQGASIIWGPGRPNQLAREAIDLTLPPRAWSALTLPPIDLISEVLFAYSRYRHVSIYSHCSLHVLYTEYLSASIDVLKRPACFSAYYINQIPTHRRQIAVASECCTGQNQSCARILQRQKRRPRKTLFAFVSRWLCLHVLHQDCRSFVSGWMAHVGKQVAILMHCQLV